MKSIPCVLVVALGVLKGSLAVTTMSVGELLGDERALHMIA